MKRLTAEVYYQGKTQNPSSLQNGKDDVLKTAKERRRLCLRKGTPATNFTINLLKKRSYETF
jgi:hypothetical protein